MSDTLIKTEQDVWNRVTHVFCHNCQTRIAADEQNLGMVIRSEDDVDDSYEFVDCCDDPSLEAMIVTDRPLFDSAVDEGYHIAVNPTMGVHADVWEYDVTDDLLVTLKREGVIT